MSNGILMLGRNGKLRIKAGLAAKQAASQQPHQQSGGNKGTEKAILHSGQADPLIFHMAMQVYRSHDFTQTELTFHLSNFLLLDTPPSPLLYHHFYFLIHLKRYIGSVRAVLMQVSSPSKTQ